MKEFLEKIGLIDHFTTIIEVEKAAFISKFEAQVKEARIDMFSDNPFDVFSSDKATYKGHVGFDGFRIKRRRKLFNTQGNYPIIAEGFFSQSGKTLIIETEINGIPLFFQLVYGLLILMFIFGFTTLLRGHVVLSGLLPLLVIPTIIGVQCFLFTKAVKNLKKDLERDFFDWSKP